MTNPFDTALIATAGAFSTTFAETIVYKPKAGGTRSIQAIVSRDPPAAMGDAPHGKSPTLMLDVENDSTTGISSDEVDTGGDLVTVAVRIGDSAQDRRITGIISQDAGRVTYGVR